jgi:nucleoside-diphosphate-sugar epimerase
MRALVIGGTGFIGARVTRRLLDGGHAVTVLHRGETESPLTAGAEHVCDPSAAFPILSFPGALARDWDVVVHMVAMGETDGAAAARFFEGRAGRLVTISSGDVYRAYGRLIGIEPGPPDPVPLTEDAPLRSVFFPYRGRGAKAGAHADSYEKILAERAVMAGPPWTILRLPKVYGPERNGDLATVYGFAAQPQWRWTHGHVDNVAHAVALAAIHPAAVNRVYNVGEAETPTMGERLARLPSRPCSRVPDFDYAQDIAYDTGRIRRELGFTEIVDEPESMAALARMAGPNEI